MALLWFLFFLKNLIRLFVTEKFSALLGLDRNANSIHRASGQEECSDLPSTKDTVIETKTPRDCDHLINILSSVPILGYDFDYGSPPGALSTVSTKEKLSLPPIGGEISKVYGNDVDIGRLEALHGIGFAWQDDLHAYLAFNEPHLGEKLETARKILGSAVEKISHGVKNQMKLLSNIPQCSDMVIAAPVMDVRIAAWMRTPDSGEVCEKLKRINSP